MKTKTSLTRDLMSRSPLRYGLLLAALALACFALLPAARAVCQQGCDLSNDNTFLGDDALINNTIGYNNTAMGSVAFFSNTTGSDNTATGANALYNHTTGDANMAIGSAALFHNSTGNFNTAAGASALFNNTTGFENTATGDGALFNNTTGVTNTATGSEALYANTTGAANTATGVGALQLNTTGNTNTGIGFNALLYNTTGDHTIALGASAGINLATGSHNIDIGHHGFRRDDNTIRIGNPGTQTATFIAGISGATVPTGVAVVVDSTGHLGTTTSSARFKDAIKPMDKASEAILALKPVSFRYKKELDPDGIPQFGLVAEEVEKVNPDLVARDDQGKPYTVRYEAVNAMLLNEFINARCQIESQQKQIDALTAGLKKVSAQVELKKPAPQMANTQ